MSPGTPSKAAGRSLHRQSCPASALAAQMGQQQRWDRKAAWRHAQFPAAGGILASSSTARCKGVTCGPARLGQPTDPADHAWHKAGQSAPKPARSQSTAGRSMFDAVPPMHFPVAVHFTRTRQTRDCCQTLSYRHAVGCARGHPPAVFV